MNPIPVEPGRVVISRAGRDRKRYLVVLKLLDADHALVADGKTRKVDSPKKKKLKHLHPKPERLDELAQRLDRGESIHDSEVRKYLEGLGYNLRQQPLEEGRGLVQE